MTTVERTALIESSTSQVWALLADFEAISAWAPNVDHSALMTDQTEGVGMVRRVQVGRMALVETVTEWEAGVVLSYTISGMPAVVGSVSNSWRLGTSGSLTMVWLTTTIDAGPRPPRVVAGVVGRKLGQASEEMLAGFQAHLGSKVSGS